MKAKTVVVSFLAGALVCFSNVTQAQYHSNSSSSSSYSSSSSSGNAFDMGTNVISVGVGFGGGLGSYSIPGYTTSSGVGINASFEHALSEHWGLGLTISYSSSSLTYNQSGIYDSGGTGVSNFGQNYTYGSESDKYTLSVLGFTVRGYYHFATSAKFDPYVGIGLGYADVSFKFTQTLSPNMPGYNTYEIPGISISGVAGGAFVGARYYFSDHIGVWLELQYDGYVGNIANLGLAFKL